MDSLNDSADSDDRQDQLLKEAFGADCTDILSKAKDVKCLIKRL